MELRSLREAKGRVAEFTSIAKLRSEMIKLLDSTPPEETHWFFEELKTAFPILIQREAGFRFLANARKRIDIRNSGWDVDLWNMCSDAVITPSAVILYEMMLGNASDDHIRRMTEHLLETYSREASTTQAILKLLHIIIEYHKDRFELFSSLIEYDWLAHPEKTDCWCVFLEIIRDDVYIELVRPIINNLEAYIDHDICCGVMNVVSVRGPHWASQRVVSFLINLPNEQLFSGKFTSNLVTMSLEATRDQIEQILLKLSQLLQTEGPNNTINEWMCAALSVCPLREKIQFLSFNEKWLGTIVNEKLKNEIVCIDASLQLMEQL